MTNRKDLSSGVVLKNILTVAAAILMVGGVYYLSLPPINIYSSEFWSFFFFTIAVGIAADLIISHKGNTGFTVSNPGSFKRFLSKLPLRFKILASVLVVVIVLLIIMSAFSSRFLMADAYSSMITVTEESFDEGIARSEVVSDIALMDSSSARIIGNRTLGSLSDLVSQYEVAYDYTQIALNSKPYKVAPLEYASFFKWLNNSEDGIPGYVLVDPVNFDAEFKRLDKFIKYSPSAYFGDNLNRVLRFKFPFEIFDKPNFEIDEDGNPYWVCPTMKPKAGLFGGYDVSGVVVLDACTGDAVKYSLDDIPDWIDIVYNGNLICQKYDWYGELSGGYINYMFSQTGCTATTDDFGYKIIGNDVYIYTGVTSLSNDAANIGFILVNSRTGEYKFFSVPGAEEHSAMSAAEGAVQHFGYKASFPSLINVNGEPTYIMVLKDDSEIVKLYAMVNVENYNIVVTSESQVDVFEKYIVAAELGGRVEIPEKETVTAQITVESLEFITENGNTALYIVADGNIYRIDFSPELLLLKVGNLLEVKYESEPVNGAYNVVSTILLSTYF